MEDWPIPLDPTYLQEPIPAPIRPGDLELDIQPARWTREDIADAPATEVECTRREADALVIYTVLKTREATARSRGDQDAVFDLMTRRNALLDVVIRLRGFA